MTRTPYRKVLRDLFGYRARTALVVISIAVGVLAAGMIIESRIVLARQLEHVFLESDPPSAQLTMATFDDGFVKAAGRTPGVTAAEGRRTVIVQLQTGADQWVDLSLTVIPDFTAQTVDKVLPQSGPWPPPRGAVVIERSTLKLVGGTEPGGTFTIQTPDQRIQKLQFAGVAYAPGELAGYAAGTPFGFVTADTLADLGLGRGYDTLLVRVGAGDGDPTYVTSVANKVSDQANTAGHDVSRVDVKVPLQYPGEDTMKTVYTILMLLGGLTLVVSVFLVINTVTAVVGTQTRQIGVMKAIGARKTQLRGMYRGLVGGYGLLAAVIAIPLAALGSVALTAYTAGLLNLDSWWMFPPALVIGVEVAMAIAVPLLAAIVPVDRGVRITVREAISSAGIAAGFGKGLLDRAIARITFFRPAERFALRNTFRRRGRLAITLAALALGGAVFIAVLSVQASLNATLERGVAFFGFDAQLTLKSPTRATSLAATAGQVPGVTSAEPWLIQREQRVEPDGSDGPSEPVYGIPAGSTTLQPTVSKGRWLLPGDQNALVATDNLLDDEPDLHVGQQIDITIGQRKTTWTVVGIVQAPTRRTAFYANLEPLAAAAGIPGNADVVVVKTQTHDRATQDQVAAALKSRLERGGIDVAGSVTIGYVRDQQTMQFDVLVTFLAVMAALVGAVGGIGLSGTMTLNVSERTREIGVLRAIGASNRAVRTIFLAEGWAMGVMAWLAGIVLAVPISVFMSRRIGEAFLKRPLQYAFSWTGVAVWLVVILVVSTIATLAPAAAAARVTVRETLSYE